MNIKKNFVYNGLLLLSQYIVPMIVFPYISRVFGIDKVGVVNWVDGTINYLILLSTLGITLTGIRETAKHKSDKVKLSQAFNELLVIHVIWTSLVTFAFIVVVQQVDKFNQYDQLFYIGISKLIFNVFLIEWFFRGIENFKFITVRSLFIKLLYVLCVFLFVKSPNDYDVYFILTCLITVVNASINLWYAKKHITYSFSKLNLKRHIPAFFTIGLYLVLTSMYTTFNVTYLGIVSTDKAVGSYTTALKLYTIILGTFTALNTVLMPRLSALKSEKDESAFNRIIGKSVNFVSTFSIPIIVTGIYLAPEIITLISGDGYTDAIPCLRIILPMTLIVGLAQIFSNQVLMSLQKDTSLAYTAAAGALFGITLNFLLVPKYGEIGTSITVLISELAVTCILYAQCYHFVGLKFPVREIVKNGVFSIPYILIIYIVKQQNLAVTLTLALSGFASFIYFVLSQNYLLRNSLIQPAFSTVQREVKTG